MNPDYSAPAFSIGKMKRSKKTTHCNARFKTFLTFHVDEDKRKDRDLKNVGPGSYKSSLYDKKQEPKFT